MVDFDDWVDDTFRTATVDGEETYIITYLEDTGDGYRAGLPPTRDEFYNVFGATIEAAETRSDITADRLYEAAPSAYEPVIDHWVAQNMLAEPVDDALFNRFCARLRSYLDTLR